MPGYYHRTDQSAMNCCQLLRSLHISDGGRKFMNNMKLAMPMNSATMTATNSMPAVTATATAAVDLNQVNEEIQCGDISQSQLSPAVQAHTMQPKPQTVTATHQTPPTLYQSAVLNGTK